MNLLEEMLNAAYFLYAETVVYRVKRAEMRLLRTLVTHIWAISNLVVVGHFVVFSATVSKWHITRKRLLVERNRVKLLCRNNSYSVSYTHTRYL